MRISLTDGLVPAIAFVAATVAGLYFYFLNHRDIPTQPAGEIASRLGEAVITPSTGDPEELTHLQGEFESALVRLADLQASYQAAAALANPDYELLKARALAELETDLARWQKWRNSSPGTALTPVFEQFNDERTAMIYAYYFDNLGLDPLLRKNLEQELAEYNKRSNQSFRRVQSGEISQAQHTAAFPPNASAGEAILQKHLSAEQNAQYRELNVLRQRQSSLANAISLVSTTSGPLSPQSRELLVNAYASFLDLQRDAGSQDPAERFEFQTNGLDMLETWLEGQIPAEDQLSIEVFLEGYRVRAERAFINSLENTGTN